MQFVCLFLCSPDDVNAHCEFPGLNLYDKNLQENS